jgi:hypothetical protein
LDAISRVLVYQLPISRICSRVSLIFLAFDIRQGTTLLYRLVMINSNMGALTFSWRVNRLNGALGGYTHRSVASALVFTAYCWGNLAVRILPCAPSCV